ncbi:MAG: HNH endonuclease [Syntrophothermus sp.]
MSTHIYHLTSLRRGSTPFGLAPHKPVLLLAVIDGFEKGTITGKDVFISDELLTSFYDYWNLLVDTPHTPNFALPFYHLSSERSGIWQLNCFPGKSVPLTKSNSIKSFKALRETVIAAVLSDEFYYALIYPEQRKELKETLINSYFPNKAFILHQSLVLYSEEVKKEIVYDPAENYARKVIRKFEQMPVSEREEEMILRSHIFKNAILEKYDQRCAVTGMKIAFQGNVSMVDACHIVPFAESYDDTITNGIALSPTFHRAFDRGLITVTDDYKVIVHSKVKDYYPQVGIQQYHQQPLQLPSDKHFYPSIEKLALHRKRFAV